MFLCNQSGETAGHLAVNTDDLKVMSKFIEHLGPEYLNFCDSSGNTLFHYAVGCLDEDSIYKVIISIIIHITSSITAFSFVT